MGSEKLSKTLLHRDGLAGLQVPPRPSGETGHEGTGKWILNLKNTWLKGGRKLVKGLIKAP